MALARSSLLPGRVAGRCLNGCERAAFNETRRCDWLLAATAASRRLPRETSPFCSNATPIETCCKHSNRPVTDTVQTMPNAPTVP